MREVAGEGSVPTVQDERWDSPVSAAGPRRLGAAGTEGTFAWKGVEPGMAGRTSPLFRVLCCVNATIGARGEGLNCQRLADVTEIEWAILLASQKEHRSHKVP
jgi:hypothetical protein